MVKVKRMSISSPWLLMLVVIFTAQLLPTCDGQRPNGQPDKEYYATGTAPWWYNTDYVTNPTFCWNGKDGVSCPCYKKGCGYDGYFPCQPIYNETCLFATSEMVGGYFDRIVLDDIEAYQLPPAGVEGTLLGSAMYNAVSQTPLSACVLNRVSYLYCWEYEQLATEVGIWRISNSTWAQYVTYRSIECVSKTQYPNLRKTAIDTPLYTDAKVIESEVENYDVNDGKTLFYIYQSSDGYSRVGMNALDPKRAVSLYAAIMLQTVQLDMTCTYTYKAHISIAPTPATTPVAAPAPAPAVVYTTAPAAAAPVPAPTPAVATPIVPVTTPAPVAVVQQTSAVVPTTAPVAAVAGLPPGAIIVTAAPAAAPPGGTGQRRELPAEGEQVTTTSCLFFRVITQNWSPRIEDQTKLPVKFRFALPDAYPNLALPAGISEEDNPDAKDVIYTGTQIVNTDGTPTTSTECFGEYAEYQGEDGEWYANFPGSDGKSYNITHVWYAYGKSAAIATIQTYWDPSLNDTVWGRNIRLQIKCDLTVAEEQALGWIYFTAGGVEHFDCAQDLQNVICIVATAAPTKLHGDKGGASGGKAADYFGTDEGETALYVLLGVTCTSFAMVAMYWGRKRYFEQESTKRAIARARQAAVGGPSLGGVGGGGVSAAERIAQAQNMRAKHTVARRHPLDTPQNAVNPGRGRGGSGGGGGGGVEGNGNGYSYDDEILYNSMIENQMEQDFAANIFGVLEAVDNELDSDDEEQLENHRF